MRQEVHVQIAVAVVVEEEGLRRESGEVETVLLGPVGEGAVAVVDVEHVVPVHPEIVDTRDVDVDKPVPVDVGHRDAGLPGPRVRDPGALGDVLEAVIALVQVEPVGTDVRGEVEVRQPVVVDVAHRHAAAVVVVQVGEDVECGVVGQPVGERDAGALRGQPLEELRLTGTGTARERQRCEQQHGCVDGRFRPKCGRRRGAVPKAKTQGVGRGGCQASRAGGTAPGVVGRPVVYIETSRATARAVRPPSTGGRL